MSSEWDCCVEMASAKIFEFCDVLARVFLKMLPPHPHVDPIPLKHFETTDIH